MSDQDQATAAKKLTAADAAKLVKRTVIEYVDAKDAAGKAIKKPREKREPVEESEVLTFREYDDQVVVITKDGQKLTGALK